MSQNQIPVLYTREEIYERIDQIVELINQDYENTNDLLVICVLQGSFNFSADLVRKIRPGFTLDFMELSSYEGGITSSGKVKMHKDITHAAKGRQLLVIEDIVDTGTTLNYIYEHLNKMEPAGIETAALLVKKHSKGKCPPVRYRGFEIDDQFAVGYGMDFQGKYRDLPYIGYIEK